MVEARMATNIRASPHGPGNRHCTLNRVLRKPGSARSGYCQGEAPAPINRRSNSDVTPANSAAATAIRQRQPGRAQVLSSARRSSCFQRAKGHKPSRTSTTSANGPLGENKSRIHAGRRAEQAGEQWRRCPVKPARRMRTGRPWSARRHRNG